jgi:hypothetical protein
MRIVRLMRTLPPRAAGGGRWIFQGSARITWKIVLHAPQQRVGRMLSLSV